MAPFSLNIRVAYTSNAYLECIRASFTANGQKQTTAKTASRAGRCKSGIEEVGKAARSLNRRLKSKHHRPEGSKPSESGISEIEIDGLMETVAECFEDAECLAVFRLTHRTVNRDIKKHLKSESPTSVCPAVDLVCLHLMLTLNAGRGVPTLKVFRPKATFLRCRCTFSGRIKVGRGGIRAWNVGLIDMLPGFGNVGGVVVVVRIVPSHVLIRTLHCFLVSNILVIAPTHTCLVIHANTYPDHEMSPIICTTANNNHDYYFCALVSALHHRNPVYITSQYNHERVTINSDSHTISSLPVTKMGCCVQPRPPPPLWGSPN